MKKGSKELDLLEKIFWTEQSTDLSIENSCQQLQGDKLLVNKYSNFGLQKSLSEMCNSYLLFNVRSV